MKLNLITKTKLICTLLILTANSLSAQWQTFGPYGGTFYDLQEHNGYLFTGTNTGTYRLNSNDSVWNAANGAIERKKVNLLASHNNILFAGLSGYGVFSSINNGITWSPSMSGLSTNYLMSIFSSTNGIFLGTADGVFYSTNNGLQWTLANGGIPSTYYIYCMEQMGDTIFGGSYGLGLYFTKDNGNNWNLVGGGFPANTFVYALHKIGNILIAGTSAGVYKSIDRGLNWFSSNNGFPAQMWAKCFASKPGYLFAGSYSEGIFVSADSGATWSNANNGIPDLPIQSGLPHNFPSVDAISVFNNKIFASTNFGMYVSSDNGNSWVENNNEILSTNITALASNSSCVVAGEIYTGIYRNQLASNHWERTNNGLTSVTILDLTNMGEVLFSAVQNQRVFVSTDNGSNWTWAGTGLTTDAYFLIADSTRALAITTGGQFISGGLFQTLDTGNTWVQIPTGFSGKVCAEISSSGIYVGCYQGKVYFTDDLNLNWQDLSYNLPSEKVNKVVAVGSNLFAATEGSGVYRLNLNSNLWTYLNNGISNDTIKDLIFKNNTLYAATWGGGVFFSNDSGNTWNVMNNGLNNQYVKKLVYSSGELFAGTDAGVYQYDLTLFTKNEKQKQKSMIIYPNPSNQRFQIRLNEKYLPLYENATIDILSSAGNIVARDEIILQNEMYYYPNVHLSSGNYLVKIQIKEKVFSGKLVVE
ncbi:MAG: T9SS type A sorting domain-containing protein [Bacteroidota bacterium]|jgi:photosystem II stability/assembly factor-like uncharacterized protein